MRLNKYFTIAAVALALVACDKNNDDFNIDDTKDTPISIASAGVTELTTRAGVSAGVLTSGQLSFWFNIQGENTPKYVATNEKWVYTQQGWKFEATNNDNTQLLWKGIPNTGQFYAVYPYSESYASSPDESISVTLKSDQSAEGNVLESDLLWAKGETRTNVIGINFTHMMSKFVINLTRGTEVDKSSQVTYITISDVPLEHTVSLSGQTITGTGSGEITAFSITPADGCMASYEAIVSPTTYAPALVITIGGRKFTATLNEQEFKSGYQYNISLQVGQDKVTLGSITASPWTSMTGGDLETE